MYEKDFHPFYGVYADPAFYEEERIQEKELGLMRSYYPETARRVQEKVERECDLLDYEGSRMYDEYPDRFMLYRVCRKIRRETEPAAEMEAMSGGFLDELIQVLFFQEISRRRCRRQRCRGAVGRMLHGNGRAVR